MSVFRYLAGVAASLAMAALPRRLLERTLSSRLRDDFYPTCSHVVFYKSGRSALAAVFERLVAERRGGVVLIPDYICNVVHRAAAGCELRLVAYRTDAAFHVDLDDLREKFCSEKAAALLLASLFGCQNRSRQLIERIRSFAPETLLIIDDCQNLVVEAPFCPDHQTVVVFSFNEKHIPGVMGGGVCSAANSLGLSEPTRRVAADLALEAMVMLSLLRQGKDMLLRSAAALFGLRRRFPAPKCEHSPCQRLLYDTRVSRIARLSLARAIVGLKSLHVLASRRRENYARLRDAIHRGRWGRLVATENAEFSPLVAIEGLDAGLIGDLPLNGPYACDDDPAASLRPEVVVFRNDGACPIELTETG